VSDPNSQQTFVMSLIQLPSANASDFWYDKNGNKSNQLTSLSSFTSSSTYPPNVQTSAGSLVYDTTKSAYHLQYNNTSNGKSADIWFHDALPGVTVGPNFVSGNQTMYWTNPVLNSSVSSSITIPTYGTISVSGWRGYHDHNWGNFNLANHQWRGWEWGVSHNPDEAGFVMASTINADGTYTGEAIHASTSGTTFCNANYTASNWTQSNGEWFPLTVVQNCPGAPYYNDTWTVTGPFVLNAYNILLVDEGYGHSQIPGSVGLVEHGRTGTYNYQGS